MRKHILLDAKDWRSREDFYDNLFPELGVPEWHGRNLDALYDSIVRELNSTPPPYLVTVANTKGLESALQSYLARARLVFKHVVQDCDLDVNLVLE